MVFTDRKSFLYTNFHVDLNNLQYVVDEVQKSVGCFYFIKYTKLIISNTLTLFHRYNSNSVVKNKLRL